MTYNWTNEFNLNDALAGILVGFKNDSNPADLTNTGVLQEPGPLYKLEFNGYKMTVDYEGFVKTCKPAKYVGQKLQMVTAVMGAESQIGTGATGRTRHDDEGEAITNDKVELTNILPRDQFALNALNAMLIHANHPENLDDAACMRYARAAYRYAQAMVIVAADSRYGQSTEQSEATVDVKTEDLESNTDKLLYNISQIMKSGITVKGEEVGENQTPTPIITKLDKDSEIKKVAEVTEVKKVSDIPGLTTINTTLAGIKNELDYIEIDLSNINTKLGGTLKIDNPTDDKFDVEGAGGGSGIDYDKMNDIATDISSLAGFNGKAPGRTSIADLITKLISALSDTQKASLYTAIKSKMDADFDAKGAAAQALTDAKKYTDDEIKKKHP